MPLPAECGTHRFEYKATITATALELDGTLELSLSAGGPVYNTGLVLWSADHVTRIAGPKDMGAARATCFFNCKCRPATHCRADIT